MATRIIEQLVLDEDPHTVSNWLERLENAIDIALFNASDKLPTDETAKVQAAEGIKVNYLLSSLGPSSYKLLKSYCVPDNPKQKTFKELTDLLRKKLAPTLNTISEEHKFGQLKQGTNETLTVFMGRIKEAATTCDFGTMYDKMVRNRFITGMKSDKIRTSLLGDCSADTTADKVLEKALTKEQASQCNLSMTNVNFVNKSKGFNSQKANSSGKQAPAKFQKKSGRSGNNQSDNNVGTRMLVCDRCTLRGHSQGECRTRCRYCKAIGHIVEQCPKLKAKKRTGSSHHVDKQISGDHEPGDEYGFTNEDETSTTWINHVEVEGMLSSDNVQHNLQPSDKSYSNDLSLNIDFSDNSTKNLNFGKVDNSMDLSVHYNGTDLNPDSIHDVKLKLGKPYLNLHVNDKPLKMELDTGSTISCISKLNFEKLNLSNCLVEKCDQNLCVANGQLVKSSCRAIVNVKFRCNSYTLPLYVVDSQFPTLMGREWIRVVFGNDWLSKMVDMTVNQVRDRKSFIDSIKKSSVFDPGVGDVTGFEAALDLKPDSRPKFRKARPVSFAMKEAVGTAIDKLVEDGIWRPVDHSEYASPIVPVTKDDGSIRVCGDYKSTLNPNLDTAVYPLPTMEDCLSKMVGGELFSRLDIKQAYNNLRLRESDQKLVTVNTHKGLFCPVRLPFGVSSAGAIFQRKIDQVLQGIPGVVCRVDDILITGPNDTTHMDRLKEVITRLEAAGFKCRVDKCKFMQPSVVYIGHEISKHGIRPLHSKVDTLLQAKYPDNLSQLVSFLGAVQYYSRYIPNLSTIVEPLNRLRAANVPWKFGPEQQKAFDTLKGLLASTHVLAVYDPSLDLKVDADASSVGIGAVISQVDKNGCERPVEFISRTLSKAEKNYSQIEKEALAIVWSVKRFHRYIYARPFTLVTDHKPLEFIFHPHKGIPEMGISRIVRWALALSSYQYTIKYRPTYKHSNADMCSRFPLANEVGKEELDKSSHHSVHQVVSDFDSEDSVFSIHYIGDDKPLLDSSKIARETLNDPVLSKVMFLIKDGWPKDHKKGESNDLESKLKPFRDRRNELSIDTGCIIWGSRVIIPSKLQCDILDLLHSTHSGIVSMKALARCYIWWPGLDSDIEQLSRKCEVCQLNQRKPPSSIPHPWVKPNGPWERLHLDFCGPVFGSMWLIVIDAFSKWIEVIKMSSIKSKPVIRELRTLFSRFGLPRVCVSDNGPQLVSGEMEDFMSKNGIKHILVPSYHPASNGQVESIVGKFKAAMKRMLMKNPDVLVNLANWLMSYRNTPHPTTGIEPSVAMIGRRARSALSLVHPFNSSKKSSRLLDHEQTAYRHEKPSRSFSVGESVLYWDQHNSCWKEATIKELQGSKVFLLESETGQTRKHLDHIVKCEANPGCKQNLTNSPSQDSPGTGNGLLSIDKGKIVTIGHDHEAQPLIVEKPLESVSEQMAPNILPENSPETPKSNNHTPLINVPTETRHSSRVRTKPDRLAYHELGKPT